MNRSSRKRVADPRAKRRVRKGAALERPGVSSKADRARLTKAAADPELLRAISVWEKVRRSRRELTKEEMAQFARRPVALLGRVLEPTFGRPRKGESDLEYDLRIAGRVLKVVPADSLAYEQAAQRRRDLYRRVVKLPTQISPKGAKARSAKARARRLAKARRVVRDPRYQAILRVYRTFPKWFLAEDIIRLTVERLYSDDRYSGDLDRKAFESLVREQLKPLLAARTVARKAPMR